VSRCLTISGGSATAFCPRCESWKKHSKFSVNCCRRIADVSLHLEIGRPADAGQGVEQRTALDAEGAADRGLGRTAVESGDNRRQLFAVDSDRAPASAAAAPGRREARPYPLLDQRPLELGRAPRLSRNSRTLACVGNRLSSPKIQYFRDRAWSPPTGSSSSSACEHSLIATRLDVDRPNGERQSVAGGCGFTQIVRPTEPQADTSPGPSV
jgi:hypothetical protein